MSSVITAGFGNSAALVITDGYSIGAAAAVPFAGDRILRIAAEDRTLKIIPESRRFLVPPEGRKR